LKNKKHIGVLGAGVGGLVAAHELLKKGFAVTLLEKHGAVGGMAKAVEVEGVPLEIFYHHAFKSDTALWDLCRELGIYGNVRWLKSPMGYLTDGRIYDFGTLGSLMKFKPLNLVGKLRFIISTLMLARQKDLNALEGYTADEWLRRHAGKRVYETIWMPLLVQKFADDYNKISMTFIARKVQQRSETRKFGKDESLAYIDGSFGMIIQRLKERIEELGGEIITSAKVEGIEKDGAGILITTTRGKHRFDMALATFAPEVLSGLHDFPDGFKNRLSKLRHTGAVCAMLVMKRPLTGIYWLNVGDNSFPFGAVVEHTNFWGPEHYNGRHIAYISKYLKPGDPLFTAKNDDVLSLFYKHLKRIKPEFDESGDIVKAMVFRERYAQPVITSNYSRIKPDFQTPLKDLYWISTSHIYPEDRGVNYSIKLGMDVSEIISKDRPAINGKQQRTKTVVCCN